MSLFSGDEAQLQKVLDEAIDRLAVPKLIEAAQTAIRAEVNNASVQLQAALTEATGDIKTAGLNLKDDGHELLDRLSGTTVTVIVKPIILTLNIPARKPAAIESGAQGETTK